MVEGQQYSRFDLSADVTLPFPRAGDVALLGRDAAGEAYQVFDLIVTDGYSARAAITTTMRIKRNINFTMVFSPGTQPTDFVT